MGLQHQVSHDACCNPKGYNVKVHCGTFQLTILTHIPIPSIKANTEVSIASIKIETSPSIQTRFAKAWHYSYKIWESKHGKRNICSVSDKLVIKQACQRHRYRKEIPNQNSYAPILPSLIASSAMELQWGYSSFCIPRRNKRKQNTSTIFVHHAAFHTCVSSCSACSICAPDESRLFWSREKPKYPK